MPTWKLTRVRSEGFWKIIARVSPSQALAKARGLSLMRRASSR